MKKKEFSIVLGKNTIAVLVSKTIFRVLRKLYLVLNPNRQVKIGSNNFQGSQYFGYVQFQDIEANKQVDNLLASGKACLVSKFGTIEMYHLLQQRALDMHKYPVSVIKDYIQNVIPTLNWPIGVQSLCFNSGFFPNDPSLLKEFYEENVGAIKQIDILGSYLETEKYFENELKDSIKVNLDGYYCPFFYNDPWTRQLKGKKVLVIHPFAEDIKSQYELNRERIWKDPEVLPEFTLITYKAIQSIMGIKTEYNSWFDALQKMKDDIGKIDFDIALVGCGAYGMPLAAYCKKMGKQAVHLAGWTQVLFGIIGTRWENNPQVSPYINNYWIHPSSSNRPKNADKIENACYW